MWTIISTLFAPFIDIIMTIVGGLAAVGIAWFMGSRAGLQKAKVKQLEETIEVERSQRNLQDETTLMSDQELNDAIDPWVRD